MWQYDHFDEAQGVYVRTPRYGTDISTTFQSLSVDDDGVVVTPPPLHPSISNDGRRHTITKALEEGIYEIQFNYNIPVRVRYIGLFGIICRVVEGTITDTPSGRVEVTYGNGHISTGADSGTSVAIDKNSINFRLLSREAGSGEALGSSHFVDWRGQKFIDLGRVVQGTRFIVRIVVNPNHSSITRMRLGVGRVMASQSIFMPERDYRDGARTAYAARIRKDGNLEGIYVEQPKRSPYRTFQGQFERVDRDQYEIFQDMWYRHTGVSPVVIILEDDYADEEAVYSLMLDFPISRPLPGQYTVGAINFAEISE